jgi:opine dehydrogenase
MKIAVLGSGNGGFAVAFDCASHGHEIYLFDFETFSSNIRAVQENIGIHSEGQLEGFAPVVYAGHDIETACNNADLVMIVGPAYSTRPFAQIARRCIQDGQIIIVCPGSCCGSIEFMNSAGLTIGKTGVTIGSLLGIYFGLRGAKYRPVLSAFGIVFGFAGLGLLIRFFRWAV